ncbi:hypothetical protein [Szabonella alba]|nr:hypothetical protein [Szabonella alba]
MAFQILKKGGDLSGPVVLRKDADAAGQDDSLPCIPLHARI